ncbi:hypothetical protein [Candidatus Amarolinea dominans]|uniref:hypothetical protein n=1 Tax=Candidatus Amarolinea dominans TaxID=3140696 RepID=UPI00313700BB|nr:hypothetical protein [Anaerolineae bacterium]
MPGASFTLDASVNSVLQPGFVFLAPVTVTLDYADSDLVGLDENTLMLSYFDTAANQWSSAGITLIERDTVNNRLVVTISHLSLFAAIGAPPLPTATLTATPTATGTPTRTRRSRQPQPLRRRHPHGHTRRAAKLHGKRLRHRHHHIHHCHGRQSFSVALRLRTIPC